VRLFIARRRNDREEYSSDKIAGDSFQVSKRLWAMGNLVVILGRCCEIAAAARGTETSTYAAFKMQTGSLRYRLSINSTDTADIELALGGGKGGIWRYF